MGSQFLQSYVTEMSKYTDAPTIFHRANGYTMLSAIFSEYRYRYYLDGGVPAPWPNLWTMLIGDSGGPRKSTTVNMMLELLSIMYPKVKGPDEMTPEGLAAAMQKRTREESEMSANLFLVFPEMGTMLASAGRDFNLALKPMLLDFFDTKPEYRKQLSQREFMVKRPRVSICGALATELLPEYTTGRDWLGGFMSRFLVIRGEVPPTGERELPSSPQHEVYTKLAKKGLDLINEWKKTRQRELKRLREAGEARSICLRMSPGAKKELQNLPPPEQGLDYNMALVLTRAGLHLRRLSAIAQLDLDPTVLEISREAVLRAREELWDQWRADVPNLVSMCFARGKEDFEGDRLPRRMIRVLAAAKDKGASVAELLRSCGLDVQAITGGITALVTAGLATESNEALEDGQPPQRIVKLTPKGFGAAPRLVKFSDPSDAKKSETQKGFSAKEEGYHPLKVKRSPN